MENIAAAPNTEELGSNAFLKLFVTQLQYQNPMEPVKNEDFLAQLAQFSSLEQLGKQTDLLAEQSNNTMLTQGLQEIEIASSLIGKEIVFSGSDGNLSSSIVKGVTLKEDGVHFKLENGSIPISSLIEIR